MKGKLSEFIGVLLQLVGLGIYAYYDSSFILSIAIFFLGTLLFLGALYKKDSVSILDSYIVIITSLTIVVMAFEGILEERLVDYGVVMILFLFALLAIPFYKEQAEEEKRVETRDFSSFNVKDEDEVDDLGGSDKDSRQIDVNKEESSNSKNEESSTTANASSTSSSKSKWEEKAPNSNNTKAEMKDYLDYKGVDYDDDLLKDEIYTIVKRVKQGKDPHPPKTPNSNSTKAEMKEYLDYHDVDYEEDMLKDEIYDLVKEVKNS